jgi:glyceraldehyde-3-phosphate dehydrogenase (NAD(P))
LAVDSDCHTSFEELGHHPKYGAQEAIERATVVIDCTPAGNANKERYYNDAKAPMGFLTQGSEFGFGKMYARGINDQALARGDDRFIHVVSCNTHNISALVRSIALEGGVSHLETGRFLCMRRTNDISQEVGFAPSPTVEAHGDPRFGTHHARDAHALFETIGLDLPLWSSAVKLNTQYMHAIWFSLTLDREITVDDAKKRFAANSRVALTHKKSANTIFSFGRDHGYFGRILSQTVIPIETLAVRNGNELVGFCFTPQDGNALLSSVAATLWYLHPGGFEDRIDVIRPYLFQEI